MVNNCLPVLLIANWLSAALCRFTGSKLLRASVECIKNKATWAPLDRSIAANGSGWQWMSIVSSTLNLQRFVG